MGDAINDTMDGLMLDAMASSMDEPMTSSTDPYTSRSMRSSI